MLVDGLGFSHAPFDLQNTKRPTAKPGLGAAGNFAHAFG